MRAAPMCLAILAGLLTSACSPPNAEAPASVAAPPAAAPAETAAAPVAEPTLADAFMAGIAQHCWRSFAGKIVANEPADANDPFVGKPLVMHVRECGEREFKIPFHVGDDHSRTWVLTRTESGLRLKHDHRHQDGSPDTLTMYGGDTAAEGSATRQEFPVDAESIALFEAEGRSVSTTNVWAMEVEPGKRFVYELARPGRLFRVEFDLTTEVPTPPDPWGHEAATSPAAPAD